MDNATCSIASGVLADAHARDALALCVSIVNRRTTNIVKVNPMRRKLAKFVAWLPTNFRSPSHAAFVGAGGTAKGVAG